MIVKLCRDGANTRKLIAYLFAEMTDEQLLEYARAIGDDQDLHVRPHVMAGSDLVSELRGKTPGELAKWLDVPIRKVPDELRAFHFVMALDKKSGETLTDRQWEPAIADQVRRFGLGPCRWAAVNHSDGQHVHVVVTRMTADGQRRGERGGVYPNGQQRGPWQWKRHCREGAEHWERVYDLVKTGRNVPPEQRSHAAQTRQQVRALAQERERRRQVAVTCQTLNATMRLLPAEDRTALRLVVAFVRLAESLERMRQAQERETRSRARGITHGRAADASAGRTRLRESDSAGLDPAQHLRQFGPPDHGLER